MVGPQSANETLHLMPVTAKDMESVRPHRGTKTKLLAVVLIILGVLDAMLSWRAGFALSSTYLLLFIGGITLFVIGSVRHWR